MLDNYCSNRFEVPRSSSLYFEAWVRPKDSLQKDGVGVSIPENEDIDFTLYPCISADGKYSQAWMNNKQGKFKRYFVSIDSKTDLNIKDKKLFKRFIKYQC